MAIIKAISSKAAIGQAIDYVTKEEKTEEKLVSGLNCDPDTAKEEMQITKKVWGKTGGRTYKHFVQSFHKDELITLEQAHELAKEFANKCPQFKGFEVLIATHKDKEHIHTHFILNSVSYENGYKFRMHKSELQEMKDLSDQICSQKGFFICEKGKTFFGEEREETVAWSKDKYNLLEKADKGKAKSYVYDIALAVMNSKGQAISREDFIRRMAEKGYKTTWEDSKKHITFENQEGKKVRASNLEKTFRIPLGKEQLEHEFNQNIQRAEERKLDELYARHQLNSAAVPEDRGIGNTNIQTVFGQFDADERVAEEKREDNIAQRNDREVQRERLNLGTERGVKTRELSSTTKRTERKTRKPRL